MPFNPSEQQPAEAAQRALRLRRVVVIDDSGLDAELLELRLRSHYPLPTTHCPALESVPWLSGPDGVLDQIAEHRPDLLVTNHHMPRYDVVAAVAALRSRWPLLPVLVISGLVGEEQAL